MSEKIRILIYEKDENLGNLLQEYLQMQDYKVELCLSVEHAYDTFSADSFSLCILDVDANRPDEIDLGRKMRLEKDEVVLIFMASRPDSVLVSSVFQAGADDLVRKPFILEELQARINAILWRSRGEKTRDVVYYQIGNYFFDTRKQTLKLGDEEALPLTTKECALLTLLCEHANRIIERSFALRSVWKSDSYFNARSMDVYITKLRKLLKGDPNLSIVNIHGHGYKLVTRSVEM